MLSARNTVANQSALALRPQLRAPAPAAPDTRSPTPEALNGEIIGACEAVADLMRLAVFDTEGKLVAVLGIASIDAKLLRHSHAFTGTVMDGAADAPIDIGAIRPHPPEPAYPAQPAPSALARGGMPPKALRRVRDYIDAHLEESIGLKDLAEVAGLSMFHFARAFKQSQGVTPNCYLFQRRVERAQQLLADSNLPLCEIAIATGFSDQSHFARRFREHVGTTPAKYRWSKR
jgi:AraC-like DNA-binding protein